MRKKKTKTKEKTYLTKKQVLSECRRYAFAVLAAVIFAVNIKILVRTAGLFPGGFTGITLLIQKVVLMIFNIELPYSLINYSLNLFPIILGFRKIGKKFTIASCIVIVLSGLLTDLIPSYILTDDILLISIFGGLINGFAVSLCLYGDAGSGGTDFISIYFAEKYIIDPWNYMLIFNAIILVIAGALFGWKTALYSIIFQFVSTQVVNSLNKNYKKVTLLVITTAPDKIYNAINMETHHSATKLVGTGCYRNEEKYLIYSVVSGKEARPMVDEIKKNDPSAFVNVLKSDFIDGNFYRKTNY